MGKLIAGYHLARGAVSTAAMPGRLAYQHHMQNKMQRGITDSLAVKSGETKSGATDPADKSDKDKIPSETGDMPKHDHSSKAQGNKNGSPNDIKDGKTADANNMSNDVNSDTSGGLYEGGKEDSNLESEIGDNKDNVLNGFDPEQGSLNSANDMQRMEKDLNNDERTVDSVIGDRQVKYKGGRQINMPGTSNSNHTDSSKTNTSGESKAKRDVIFSDK